MCKQVNKTFKEQSCFCGCFVKTQFENTVLEMKESGTAC